MYGKDSEELQWWQQASRYRQILRDVQRRQPTRWFAIDDDLEGWPANELTHVLACSPLTGLGDSSAQAELTARLEVWQ
jgi:hypothetical protein